MKRLPAFLIPLIALCACAKAPMTLEQQVNRQVELVGKAANAKGGAVVLVDGQPVYLEGVESWPDEALDTEVTVGGKLVSKQYLPEADDGAEKTAGAHGPQWVLEEPDWTP